MQHSWIEKGGEGRSFGRCRRGYLPPSWNNHSLPLKPSHLLVPLYTIGVVLLYVWRGRNKWLCFLPACWPRLVLTLFLTQSLQLNSSTVCTLDVIALQCRARLQLLSLHCYLTLHLVLQWFYVLIIRWFIEYWCLLSLAKLAKIIHFLNYLDTSGHFTCWYVNNDIRGHLYSWLYRAHNKTLDW